jgi:hypothetical protein
MTRFALSTTAALLGKEPAWDEANESRQPFLGKINIDQT